MGGESRHSNSEIRTTEFDDSKEGRRPQNTLASVASYNRQLPSSAYGTITNEITGVVEDTCRTAEINQSILDDHLPPFDTEPGYFELLQKNPPFRQFMVSYTINHVGEWLTYIASLSAIEEIQLANGATETSKTTISVLVIMRLLPNVLFSPFGGVLADGWDRRNSMIALDCTGAMVALLFVLAIEARSISMIYLASFLQQTIAGLYEPCRSAIVPLLLTDEKYLKKATTVAGLAWSVVAAFGAAAGGFIVALLGIRTCYFLDMATYILSALLLNCVEGSYDVSAETSFTSPFQEIKEMLSGGVNYLQNSFFGPLVLIKASAALSWGATDVLNVSFAERGSESGRASRLGFLFSAVGVGCLVGPLISDHFTHLTNPRTLQLACIYSFGVATFGYICLGLFRPFGFLCFFTAVRCTGSAVLWIYSSILLQKFSSPDMLGRVLSIDYALAVLMEALSAYLGGTMQDHFGISEEHICFILGGLGSIFMMSWGAFHVLGGGACHYQAGGKEIDSSSTDCSSCFSGNTESRECSERDCLLPDSAATTVDC